MTSSRERWRVDVEAGMDESIASGPGAGAGTEAVEFSSSVEAAEDRQPGDAQLAAPEAAAMPVPSASPASPASPTSLWARAVCCLLMLAVAILFVGGCGQFFAKTPTGTGTGTPTGTGTYLYVANNNGTGTSNLAGFALNSGTLTAVSGSPYNLGDTPLALALTPNNQFLYVAGYLTGLYVFPVNSSNGSLGAGTSLGSVLAAQALAIDPTGQWLLAMSAQSGGVPQVSVFAINATTGALTLDQTQTANLDGGSPGRLLFVPGSGTTSLVYASLRTDGVNVLSFDSSSGTLTNLNLHLNTRGNAYSDVGLAATPDGQYLYVAEIASGGVRSFSIGSNGSLTELAGSPTTAGPSVNAVLVDATGSYLYVSNTNTTLGNATPANVINAFAISSTDGTLTPVTGSPFAACTTPLDLAEDSTKSYLAVACQGGSPDLQVFPFSSTVAGGLGTAVGASTGTTTPAGAYAVVASH